MRRRNPQGYEMSHRPPDRDSGAPIHDLTANGIYPVDVYARPDWYDGHGEGEQEAWSIALRKRGLPDGGTWIYRAVPQRSTKTIYPGDWVTTAFRYARLHGKDPRDSSKDMDVLVARVRNKDIHTAGDSILEWGYNGPAPIKASLKFRARKRSPKKPAAWRPSRPFGSSNPPRGKRVVSAMRRGRRRSRT